MNLSEEVEELERFADEMVSQIHKDYILKIPIRYSSPSHYQNTIIIAPDYYWDSNNFSSELKQEQTKAIATYESWYNRALTIIKANMPSASKEFEQYRRKNTKKSNFGIIDILELKATSWNANHDDLLKNFKKVLEIQKEILTRVKYMKINSTGGNITQKISTNNQLPIEKQPLFQKAFDESLLLKEIRKQDEKDRGANGIFYTAYSRSEETVIGIKLYIIPINDQKRKDLLLKEANKLKNNPLPTLVKIYDWNFFKYENNEYLYIIMEYIRGKALKDINLPLLKADPFENRLKILFGIINSIEHLRTNYEMHGDLHLGNIMITTADKSVKIIDPGFSSFLPEGYEYDINKIKMEIIPALFNTDEMNITPLKELLTVQNSREMFELLKKYNSNFT